MSTKVRRVVTGQGPRGRSFVCSDGHPPFSKLLPDGTVVFDVWKAQAAPEILRFDNHEPTDADASLDPPYGGNKFRIADLAPASKVKADLALGKAMFEQLGSSHALDTSDRRGVMHRTETIDYAIVLSGGMTLILDEGEVLLTQGDIVIQRGSNHMWYNHTDEVCRIAFIMIDATFATESPVGDPLP